MHLHLIVHGTERNLRMLQQCARSLNRAGPERSSGAAAVEAAEAVLVRRGVDACRSVAPRFRIPGRSLPSEAGRPRTAPQSPRPPPCGMGTMVTPLMVSGTPDRSGQ